MPKFNRLGTLAVLAMAGFAGCSTPEPAPVQLTCRQQHPLPAWTDESFVGSSRITASGSGSDQRRIALERAIAELLMSKGRAEGDSVVAVEKALRSSGSQESYTKNFTENGTMRIAYEAIDYDIRIKRIWRDPCTRELYVQVEEE